MPQRQRPSLARRWDEVAADRSESSWTRARDRDRGAEQQSPAGHFGSTARGQARRGGGPSPADSHRRLGVFDASSTTRAAGGGGDNIDNSAGESGSSYRRHSAEGHFSALPGAAAAGAAAGGGGGGTSTSMHTNSGDPFSSGTRTTRASFRLGLGGGGSDDDETGTETEGETEAESGGPTPTPTRGTSSSTARSSSTSTSIGRRSSGSGRHRRERSGSTRTSTVMSADDEGGLDAPNMDSGPRKLSVGEGEGEDDGGGGRHDADAGAIRGGERNSGGSSHGDSIINNDDDDDDDDDGGTEAMDVLNRNEAVLMSHDFHYAEYLDTRHHPAGGPRSSKNSASGLAGSASSSAAAAASGAAAGAATGTGRSAAPSGGYSSTDDSARSYRRTTIAHHGDPSKTDSYTSLASASAAGSHRRRSYPPPQQQQQQQRPRRDSDSSLSGPGALRRPSADGTATPTPEDDSDDADYGRGRSVEGKERRPSDVRDGAPVRGGGMTSSDETGTDDNYDDGGGGGGGRRKAARRFSGHSMASINLILPRMDDSVSDADGKHEHRGSRRNSRDGKSRGGRRTDPPGTTPDLNPRWQGSMTDLMHANAGGGAGGVRRSRSISPHRRRAIEAYNRSGNASTNFARAGDAAKRWSDSDGSSPGTGTKSRVSSLSGSEGQTAKKDGARIHRGGLKGMWSRVIKTGDHSSRDVRKSSENKSKGRRRNYGIDSPENNSGSSSSFGGRRGRKVKTKTSDIESGRGADNTDTGSLVGQGKLGDKMVVGGSKFHHLPPNKRRRVVLQCCLALVLLILAFVLPLLLKVPGLVPPRTAEVLEDKAKELFDRLSSAASNPFSSSPEQYDDLGRPLSGMSVEDPSTLFEQNIDDARRQVPALLRNLLDVDAPTTPETSGVTATPFLWHMDHSGSDVLEEIIAICLGRRVASDLAGNTKAQIYTTENHLRVVTVEGGSYLNVDLSTMVGIDRGRELGLLSSGFVDTIVSPEFFYASTQLFDTAHQGRVVCMFRDPVSRELQNYQDFIDSVDRDISLEEYLHDFDLQEDFVVRTISGNDYGNAPASPQMLEKAKAIIRTKCLVGLHEHLAPSIARVEEYFGYGPIIDAPPSARPCIDEVRREEEASAKRTPKAKEGDATYQTIMSRNQFDAELYEFAKVVWEEQGQTIFERQRGGKTFRTMRLPAGY